MKVQTWVGRTFLLQFTGAIAINSFGCVATACSIKTHSTVALSRQSEATYKSLQTLLKGTLVLIFRRIIQIFKKKGGGGLQLYQDLFPEHFHTMAKKIHCLIQLLMVNFEDSVLNFLSLHE